MQQFDGSLGKRLVMNVGMGIAALIIVAILATLHLNQKIQIEVNGVKAAEQLGGVIADFITQVQEWKNVLLRGQDSEARDKYWSSFKKHGDSVLSGSRALQTLLKESGDGEFSDEISEFISAHQEMMRKYEEGFKAFEEANFDAKTGDAAVKGMDRAPSEALTKLNKELAEHLAEEAKGSSAAVTLAIAAMVIAGVIIVVWLRQLLQRSVGDRTIELQKHMNQMSNGDFSQRVTYNGNDEIAAVMYGMEQVREFVAKLTQDINTTSNEIGAVASSMTRSSQQLSSVVVDSESRIHQAATALNEMTATVSDIARSAANASQVTDTVNRSATEALSEMERNTASSRQLADEMSKAGEIVQRLRDETKNIGTVLEVIKGIAEQTNLLALNAAIEAARAGEQGRGFAVVADEVRTLASRTQSSTQEIQQIIQNVQSGATAAATAMEQGNSRTRESAEQAEHARAGLAEITGAVANIRDMNAQIATAAEEQAATVAEINRNVHGVSDSAKTSNDHAHQSLSTANQLNNVAGKLHDLVLRIRT